MTETSFNKWTQLMIYCTKLTSNQRVVLGFIIDMYNNMEFDNTSLSFISESTGISVSTVQRALNTLEDMKLIKPYASDYKKNVKATNGYKPNMDLIEETLGQNDRTDKNGMVKMTERVWSKRTNGLGQNDRTGMVKMTEDTNVITKEKIKENANEIIAHVETPNHLFSFDASQAGTDSQSNDISIEPSDDDDYISSMEDVFNASCTVQYAAVNLDGEIHSPSNVRTAMEETNTPLSPTIKVCAPSSKVCHSAKDLLRLMEVIDTNNPTDEDFNILMESSVMDSLIDMTLSTVIHIAESGHKDTILNEVLDNEFKTINGLSQMNYRKTSYIAKYNEARTLLNAA